MTIKTKLYTMAFILGSFFIGLNIILYNNTTDVKDTWDNYNSNIKYKITLLSKIKNDLGYGGAIHSFKNYLVRGDEKYINQFNKKYASFMDTSNSYLNIKTLSIKEKELIYKIASTFEKYKLNILKIQKLKQKGYSISQIDEIIKINDRIALDAMNDLEAYYDKVSKNTTIFIHQHINNTYTLSTLSIVLLILLVLGLGLFFEKNVIGPLRKFEIGLDNFFKFLNKEITTIDPIDIKGKSEFGLMAQKTNENIIIASKLHKDLELKNTELSNLIESFSENVIASKTDKSGKIIYVTKAFEKISGFKSEDLINKPHNIVRHPDMPKEVFVNLWSTITKGKVWRGEVKNVKKDGGYYWVRAIIKPILDNSGNIEGYNSIREDITNSKLIEKLNNELNDYKEHLEEKVQEATKEILELNEEIEDTQKEVVFTMGAIGESRSKETGNHVKRVAEYSKIFALHYGLDKKDAELLKQASPMHDIGKVAIPDSILKKPTKLTQNEFNTMKEHCITGYEMLKNSNRPLLQTASIVSLEHHEKWDGSGYPKGLIGEEIHIYGRITAIADVFDALGSHRCYKKAWSDEEIFKLFKKERGKHFDPKLVDIFFDNLDDFLEVRKSLQDI